MATVMQATLDVDFYRRFYRLEADEQAIYQHFNTVGKRDKWLANAQQLADVLKAQLHFDPQVYIGNVSHDLTTMLKHNHQGRPDIHFLEHFFGKLTGDAADGETFQGHAEHADLRRFTNSVELVEFSTKWDKLLAAVYAQFKFDPDFYTFFYRADPAKGANVFEQWVRADVFAKKYPNQAAADAKTDMISQLLSILAHHGVDINYFSATYTEKISRVAETPSTLNDVERPLYLFFNHARTYGLFWSQAERDVYIAGHLARCREVVDFLRGGHVYSPEALAKEVAAADAALATVMKKQVPLAVKTAKLSLASLEANWKLLRKVTSPAYLAAFQRVNPESGDKTAVLRTLIDNMVDASGHALNDQALKRFVASFFYNALLPERAGKTKAEYMELVKQSSATFLLDFLSTKQLPANMNVLVKDIELLVQNKKLIKFTKLAIRLALLVI